MQFLDAVPTRGRDYKSKKEVLEAWEGGHDFRIEALGNRHDGKHINKDDPIDEPITLNVRYKNLRNVLPIELKPKKAKWVA